METISKVYLVMEVAPCGEMYTRLTNDGKYDEPAAKHLYNQLISAVEFMVNLLASFFWLMNLSILLCYLSL